MKEGDVVGSIRALERTRTHGMTTPHKCPVCGGHGKLPDKWGGTGTYMPTATRQCHACKGTGVVWEPSFTPVLVRQRCSTCGEETNILYSKQCYKCFRKKMGSITQTCSRCGADSMITANGMCQECFAAVGMGG